MNQAVFSPACLTGQIHAPASKSDAHRLMICAALANQDCFIENIGTSDDIETTHGALCALGASFTPKDNGLIVHPIMQIDKTPDIFCNMSGSTLRFVLPIAAALYAQSNFSAKGSLNNRPLSELLQAMQNNGTQANALRTPLTLRGKLQSGTYLLPGNVSSQYISGLLFALPLLCGDSRIVLTTPLSSAGYVRMTLDALTKFGITVQQTEHGFFVPGGQTYRSPGHLRVQGDWSGAAFPLCAGAIGMQPITVRGLESDSLQKDQHIVQVLRSFGAGVQINGSAVTVQGGNLHCITLDADEIPDLVPPIAAVAAMAHGITRIRNCARLRIKESDRLETVQATLCAFGVQTVIEADTLVIYGGNPLHGACIDSFDDHRIAMMGAILAAYAHGETTLTNPMAVSKSYPTFYDDYQSLGGQVHGIAIR